jgi:hypothetical protein
VQDVLVLGSSPMDPLSLVEEHVGAVETWPTYIIRHVFVDEPDARTVKNLAGFFYGNEVPLRDAVNCVNACNGVNRGYVAKKCTSGTMCGR